MVIVFVCVCASVFFSHSRYYHNKLLPYIFILLSDRFVATLFRIITKLTVTTNQYLPFFSTAPRGINELLYYPLNYYYVLDLLKLCNHEDLHDLYSAS